VFSPDPAFWLIFLFNHYCHTRCCKFFASESRIPSTFVQLSFVQVIPPPLPLTSKAVAHMWLGCLTILRMLNDVVRLFENLSLFEYVELECELQDRLVLVCNFLGFMYLVWC